MKGSTTTTKQYSRTQRSIQNARISLFFQLLQIPLGFYTRKIFIDYLGTEVLGLNSTIGNILGFLNLSELGIGAAVAVTLYKPLHDNDYNKIDEVLAVQGYFYRRISNLLSIACLLLMCFFPFIFEKAQLPSWYSYATFITFVFGMFMNYRFNYKQVILNADQKQYKLVTLVQIARILKTCLQLLVVAFVKNGYFWWLVIEVLNTIIITFYINKIIKKEYPWLKEKMDNVKSLSRQYKGLMTMTKQLFFHKVSYFVLCETTPLIIYSYASLTLVAFYGNYMIIIGQLKSLISSFYNGMNASIGNLIAEGNRDKCLRVFWELNSSRNWIASICAFAIYELTPSFITIWIGKEYLLNDTILIIMTITLYINISRTAVDSFKDSYGLFQDIWAPISEAIINLSMSVILGYFFGLQGILLGVLSSLIIIIVIWKPYYLYKKGFKMSVMNYYKNYIEQLIIIITCMIITSNMLSTLPLNPFSSILQWILYSSCCVCSYSIILGISLYLYSQGMRDFVRRICKMVLK